MLTLNSIQLVALHNHYRKMGATYDHEKYTPHITLSYDVGDDFDVTKCAIIPDVVFHVVGLYVEPLDEEQEDAA